MRRFWIPLLFLVFVPLLSCGQISPSDSEKVVFLRDTVVQNSLPKKTLDLSRFESEIKNMEEGNREFPKPKGAVLFTGSSSIRFWKTLSEDFSPIPVINSGFGGATIAEINYYFQRILSPHKPRLLVFYAGENDLSNPEVSIDSVLNDFNHFRDSADRYLPDCRFYFISVKPSPSRWHFQEKFTEANNRFKQICDQEEKWTYIDIVSDMLNSDGNPLQEIFRSDKLHMNSQGYLIWKNRMKPIIKKAWNDASIQKSEVK